MLNCYSWRFCVRQARPLRPKWPLPTETWGHIPASRRTASRFLRICAPTSSSTTATTRATRSRGRTSRGRRETWTWTISFESFPCRTSSSTATPLRRWRSTSRATGDRRLLSHVLCRVWSMFLKKWPFPASFSLFLNFQFSWQKLIFFDESLPMTGFEPRKRPIYQLSHNHYPINLFLMSQNLPINVKVIIQFQMVNLASVLEQLKNTFFSLNVVMAHVKRPLRP